MQHETKRVPFEFKFDGPEAGSMVFEGYAAYFGNIDSYGDVIEPGAFKNAIAAMRRGEAPWPLMLAEHGGMGLSVDTIMPIGAWQDLREDAKGLYGIGKLAPTARGQDIYTLMKMEPRPAISGLSIGYIPRKVVMRTRPDEPKRRLLEVDLLEVSVVSMPANRMARISAVKSIEDLSTLSDAEAYLRDAGLSKTQAVALISRIRGIGPGDPADAAGGPSDSVADIAGLLQQQTNSIQLAALMGQMKTRI